MKRLSIEEQTSMLISSWRAIDELYVQYAKSVGLTYLGLIVLETIYNMPKVCTQKEICEKTNLPKQTVNVIIRTFWEQGFLELHEIQSDRRNKEIRFSKSGKKFGDRVIGELLKVEKRVMEQLTYEQRQEMIEIMKKAELSFKEIIQKDTL